MLELPGKDLWILPPATHSKWLSRWDWYLNFQLCKSVARKKAQMAPRLQHVAEMYEIPIPKTGAASDAPLMLASEGLLPTDKFILLPFPGETKDWLKGAKRLAIELQAKDICVFLPHRATRVKAEAVWESLPEQCPVHFVEDDEENP